MATITAADLPDLPVGPVGAFQRAALKAFTAVYTTLDGEAALLAEIETVTGGIASQECKDAYLDTLHRLIGVFQPPTA